MVTRDGKVHPQRQGRAASRCSTRSSAASGNRYLEPHAKVAGVLRVGEDQAERRRRHLAGADDGDGQLLDLRRRPERRDGDA